MNKNYNPKDIEERCYLFWEKAGLFSPEAKGGKDSYCIMLPPPNVTGRLHMGHAFQATVMDLLIRYHRMKQKKTLWQAGMDHAGISTQMVVERQLEEKGLKRIEMGRERFLEHVWEWKQTSGGIIESQTRRLGASLDWDTSRFTMDQGLTQAVLKVFESLYDEGLIYRGKRLVNWDPELQSAISDIEVLQEEEEGFLWHIRYPLINGDGFVTVATTRPETLLGDSAIAVHPNDVRYKEMVGKQVKIPLTGRCIPIIEDHYPDPEFGSGCVKITPAHDFNDHKVWSRHKNEKCMLSQPNGGLLNIFASDASVLKLDEDEHRLVPSKYAGLNRFSARERMVEDLKEQGYLVKVEKHSMKVPRGERTGSVIEPYLTMQWFVDLTRDKLPDGSSGGKNALVRPAVEVVKSKRILFHTPQWEKQYYQWLDNIEDWCISRQLWWGHQIPAWYDREGAVFVGSDIDSVRAKYNLSEEVELERDSDVLDTWFSSALWPFSTLGWPDTTKRLDDFYPTSVLVTGFDIIFFWVARMVLFSQKFMNDVPFRQVYIHGLVRDSRGKKMSKSKGNVLDPIDIIDGISLDELLAKRTEGMMQPSLRDSVISQTKQDFPNGIAGHGADALRFTFLSMASTGRDIPFDFGRIDGYKNFCNKVWNAARFVIHQYNLAAEDGVSPDLDQDNPSEVDQWLGHQFSKALESVEENINKYRFDLMSDAAYVFVWDIFCAWYLEFSKIRLQKTSDKAERARALGSLLLHMESILRMLHPMVPFLSEEIWKNISVLAEKKGDSIMTQQYPAVKPRAEMEKAYCRIEFVKKITQGIRQLRSEMGVAPSVKLQVTLANVSEVNIQIIAKQDRLIMSLAGVSKIIYHDGALLDSSGGVKLVDEVQVFIPFVGAVDLDKEVSRLQKLEEKNKVMLERTNQKLGSANFTDKAPVAVVQKEKDRLVSLEYELEQIRQQIELLLKAQNKSDGRSG